MPVPGRSMRPPRCEPRGVGPVRNPAAYARLRPECGVLRATADVVRSVRVSCFHGQVGPWRTFPSPTAGTPLDEGSPSAPSARNVHQCYESYSNGCRRIRGGSARPLLQRRLRGNCNDFRPVAARQCTWPHLRRECGLGRWNVSQLCWGEGRVAGHD